MGRYSAPILLVLLLLEGLCLENAVSELTDEQEQRLYLSFLILNQVTPGTCRKNILSQSLNANFTFESACKMLKLYRDAFPQIGCIQQDFDRLNKAICEFNSSNSTANQDLRQREYIRFVAENQMSSETCRTIVTTQMNNNANQSLEYGCTTLETFKASVSIINCTMSDYDKLHKVICEKAVPTSVPVMTYQRFTQFLSEYSFSSDQCKAFVHSQTSEIITGEACQNWKDLEVALDGLGCSTSDYKTVRSFICDCNPIDVQWRADVVAVINHLLTPQCRSSVKTQINDTVPQGLACQQFVSNKQASVQVCSKKEVEEMQRALCDYNVTTAEQIRKEVGSYVLTCFSSTCRESLQGIMNDTLEISCQNIITREATLLNTSLCNRQEINTIKESMCYKVACYGGLTSRQYRIGATMSKLPELCKAILYHSVTQLGEEPGKDCMSLNSTMGPLISAHTCSQNDSDTLKPVVCDDVYNNDKLNDSDLLIITALQILQYNITQKCHDLLWPQARQYSGNLTYGCQLLMAAGPALISPNTCTSKDYSTVEKVVCSTSRSTIACTPTEATTTNPGGKGANLPLLSGTMFLLSLCLHVFLE